MASEAVNSVAYSIQLVNWTYFNLVPTFNPLSNVIVWQLT